eukprot:6965107-Prymnesium_polylepis.1
MSGSRSLEGSGTAGPQSRHPSPVPSASRVDCGAGSISRFSVLAEPRVSVRLSELDLHLD